METTLVILTTAAAIAVVLFIYAAIGRNRFDRQTDAAIRQLERAPVRVDPAPVTEADLEELPDPIARYMRLAGVVGRAPIARAHLTQTGEFRLGPDSDWIALTATQHYTADPPRFVWDATIDVFPGVPFRVQDHYAAGDSRMLGALAGAVPIVDAEGPEIDQGSFLRFLGEGAWFPSVFLADYISWEPIDSNRARMIARSGDLEVAAVLTIDDRGALRRFTAERYFESGGTYTLQPWFGVHDAYVEVDGFRLPTRSAAGWDLEDGTYEYVRLAVDRFEFEGS